MSSCLEFEGKVVEKALEKASEALNIPKDKIKYNVVSYGSSGIFGLVGAKKAKICVTLPDKQKLNKQKSKAAASRSNEKPMPSPPPEAKSAPVSDSEPTPDPVAAKPEEEPPSKPAILSASALVREAFDLPPEEPETFETAAPDPETSEKETEEKAESFQESAPPEQTVGPGDQGDPNEAESLELGKDALQRIIDFITTDAAIHVEKSGDRYQLNVKGGNPGVLIGKKGQTLEAIQYLVEKIVNRHSDQRVRIQVDVEGYLENRRSNLRSLAKRLSEKTKQTGKPSTIGQMNSHDRRIVHLTLKDDTEVRTQSIGEGFYRKLVIFPKKKKKRS